MRRVFSRFVSYGVTPYHCPIGLSKRKFLMFQNIRFGTYNVVPRPFKDKHLHEWKDRKTAVINTIINHCDIVGIQEYDTETPFQLSQYIEKQLITHHKWEAYLPQKDNTLPFTDVFHHRLPIFWKPNLFELQNAGQFRLSTWNTQEAHITPIVEDRYCSWVKVAHKPSKEIYYVYNLHQQHHTVDGSLAEINMSYRKQTDGLNNLLTHINALPGGSNVIVLGDFNNHNIPEWFLNQSDLKESAIRTDPDRRFNLEYNSYHNWDKPDPKTNSHIDHILVSSNVKVFSTTMVLEPEGSDHYLLQSTI